MKFTKLFISFALIASVALSASSCAQSGKVQSETDSAEPKQTESVTLEQQNSGEKQEKLYFPEKNDKTNKALAEMIPEQMSSSVAEMMQKSDIVIVARVIRDDEQWLSEPSKLENTRSVVTVEEVWKGKFGQGDSVSIYETGWRYDGYDFSIGGRADSPPRICMSFFSLMKSMTETAAYADAIRAKSFWMRTKRLIRSPITLSVRRDMVRSPICLSRWRFPSLGICSA